MSKRSGAGRMGKRLAKSAQTGAEDGASKAVYMIAFGAAAAAIWALWNNLMKRAGV